MAVRLSGIPVAREMRGRIQAGVEQLHQIGQIPTMGIVRVGARPEDISYETGATKLAQSLGIAVSRTLLPGDVGERQLLEVLREVNENQRIHGCLLFRPLPAHLNTRAVLGALSSGKDIDAMTGASMGGCTSGNGDLSALYSSGLFGAAPLLSDLASGEACGHCGGQALPVGMPDSGAFDEPGSDGLCLQCSDRTEKTAGFMSGV